MLSDAGKVEVEAQGAPRRFVFVLLENFTLLSFASALDCLRIANRMAEKKLYNWVITGEAGEDDQTITCSAGSRFHLDTPLGELNRDDTVLICGGKSHRF